MYRFQIEVTVMCHVGKPVRQSYQSVCGTTPARDGHNLSTHMLAYPKCFKMNIRVYEKGT